MRVSELRRELLKHTESTDARIIIELATGLNDVKQITESGSDVSKEAEEKAFEILEMRLSGMPMAYISGEKEFYGHSFHVTPDTLIPRPDTETLVDTVLTLAAESESPEILDLCTGSGAIAASVAYALKRDVAFSDISKNALEIAKENYERITGRKGDGRLGSLFMPWSGMQFDIIASNPPYLTDKWYEETDKDVKAEPESAFIGGGADGLDLIREIVATAPSYLRNNGILAMECDYRQIGICGSLLEKSGFRDIHSVRDLAGKERVIYGRRLSE